MKKLITAPTIVSPNSNLPFELICDVSNYVVGAMLRQKRKKIEIRTAEVEATTFEVIERKSITGMEESESKRGCASH